MTPTDRDLCDRLAEARRRARLLDDACGVLLVGFALAVAATVILSFAVR